jgi:hypothetical protein
MFSDIKFAADTHTSFLFQIFSRFMFGLSTQKKGPKNPFFMFKVLTNRNNLAQKLQGYSHLTLFSIQFFSFYKVSNPKMSSIKTHGQLKMITLTARHIIMISFSLIESKVFKLQNQSH